MPKISIIVTVYNAEKYLSRAIDSIISQTFTDFELILVDDGSTDDSSSICDEYSKKDVRIRVIHQENKGVSAARNTGLNNVRGKFIGFVDSDDYIDSDMYQSLYNDITQENADISTCGIFDVYDGKKTELIEPMYFLANKHEAIKMVLEAKLISVNPVNKLYKKEVFENIKYPVGFITEDGAVMLYILENIKKIVINTKQLYYYYHRRGSITTKEYSKIDLKTIEVWENNEKYIQQRYPEFNDIAHTRVCWAYFVVLDKMVSSEIEDQESIVFEEKKIISFLKVNLRFILRNQYFTKARKISAICLCISPRLYKVLSKLEDKYVKSKN